MNQELIAVFTADGFWIDSQETKDKHTFFDENWLKRFRDHPYEALFYFGFLTNIKGISVSMTFIHRLSMFFINNLAKDATTQLTRVATEVSDETLLELLKDVPFAIGSEFITAEWLRAITFQLIQIFNEAIKDYPKSVEDFLKEQNEEITAAGRVYFHLVENKTSDYPFAFLATYATKKEGDLQVSHTPLKHALIEYEGDQEKLLTMLGSVSRVADQSNFISSFMETGELFSPLKLTQQEAYVFLTEVAMYEASGVMCRIPNWWRKKSATPKLSVSIGETAPSHVGMEALLSFSPDIFLDGEKMTRKELEALMNETSGLALLKGKWVEVDHEKLKALLDAYEQAQKLAEDGDLTLSDALRAQLQLEQLIALDEGTVEVEISQGQWLKTLKNRLLSPAEIESLDVGIDFKASLRHYQQEGFDWLRLMNSIGFGALLADDMGLGKTVQILALLEHKRQVAEAHKTLLIIPTSLLNNWQKELEKFAPKINHKILHSSKEEISIEKDVDIHLYITTYGMAVRLEELQAFKWDLVILDEAQAIKNPGTKQTKTIKKIPSTTRIAMTGTPIENKLADLWSIFDFLNSGMLGNAKEFTAFAKKLSSEGDYSRLKEVVNPFILRRLKTDKSIISDLPDKIEANAYPELSKKQIVLYQKLIKELEMTLEEAEGIQRKGVVLASIMKFKQICNHPDQYLGQTGFKPTESGKFERLKEICETIHEKRERVLVFTQFKEMTKPIATYLESIFGRSGFVLHGGTTVKKRGEMVEAFSGDDYIPFMVLSLKAGGVGLNLTNANHVIHFDRWWNPAIENQATDRAFRIGQQKNVLVHKFVTKGTIEEKIDQMLVEKQRLSGDIIAASGENWITELDNNELMNLFNLDVGGV